MFLDRLFKRPLIVVGFMFLMIALGVFFVKFIASEYAPKEDRGYFLAFMQAPEGASLEYTKRNLSVVEHKLGKLLSPSAYNDNKGTGETHGVVTVAPEVLTLRGLLTRPFPLFF